MENGENPSPMEAEVKDEAGEDSKDHLQSLSPQIEVEEEDIRQSIAGKNKPCLGKAWKNKAGEYIRYRCYDHNIEYKPGDHVFIESQRPDQPFYICNITEFKRSKRDNLMVCIRWFYRTTEVPETVYNFLIKDRYTEHGEAAIHDPLVKSRELFISSATDQFPVNVLRGKCGVTHCLDIMAVKQFEPKDDHFFYTLSYNPETRRLASTQGEIRVGPSHQAKLPPYEGDDIPPIGRPDRYEELNWEPGRTHDHDLLMYLRAARSMAAFAGMCDGGSTEDGCFAASRDDTTANALDVLHDNDYDAGKALQMLVKNPVPNGLEKQWSEDENRRFIKGLRLHGKNFFKIRAEFLPEKETGDLITYYYLWKKTPGASGSRPRGRRHRPSVLRRVKSTKESGSKKKGTSSASEVEDSGGEENGEQRNTYQCRHCSSTNSKDWHHGGKEMKLLCTNCRLHYKRYGELPLLPGTVRSQFTFRPISPEKSGSLENGEKTRGIGGRLSPDRGGEDSDSGRSYSSRSRSESCSRTPEEDMSRATTPGIHTEPEVSSAPATNGPSVTDIEQDLEEDRNSALARSRAAEAAVNGPPPPLSIAATTTATAATAPPLALSANGNAIPPPQGARGDAGLGNSVYNKDNSSGIGVAGIPLGPGGPISAAGFSFSAPGSMPANISDCQPTDLSLGGSSSSGGLTPNSSLYLPQPQFSPILNTSIGGARTPVDLTSPSPGPHPEIQVLEPEPATTPSSPISLVPRDPSPEPRIDDIECHRSQSAIFVRHLNRGENNSCARTDLFFRPVPESKLARKREERQRKTAEREERERNGESRLSSGGGGGGAGISPGIRVSHSLTPTSFSSLHDRMELDRMEKEKRDREMAEIRDRDNRMRDEMFRRGALRLPGIPPHDPYLEASRRYAAGLPSPYSIGDRLAAERMALSTDPLIRLQMAGINPEVSAHSHTHLHMHPDAALMLGQHPGIPGYPDALHGLSDILGLSGQAMRPGYRPPHPFGDMAAAAAAGLRPPGPDYLSRLMNQPGMAAGHEALQRQLLFERERGLMANAAAASSLLPGSALAASQHLQQAQQQQQRQHEEYIRARDREMKVRTLEEAARQAGGR